MNNMYGKDKFHDRQKAVLQKSAQKIENDSGWAQNNFMREYAEEILPASGAELSFGELCAIGEHVEQEAAFSAKEAMRNKIKERRDAERYKSTGMDSEQRTPNPFEDSSAIATESPKNEDTLNTTRKHADAKPTKSAGIKTSKKQSLVETTRELKKYIKDLSNHRANIRTHIPIRFISVRSCLTVQEIAFWTYSTMLLVMALASGSVIKAVSSAIMTMLVFSLQPRE